MSKQVFNGIFYVCSIVIGIAIHSTTWKSTKWHFSEGAYFVTMQQLITKALLPNQTDDLRSTSLLLLCYTGAAHQGLLFQLM